MLIYIIILIISITQSFGYEFNIPSGEISGANLGGSPSIFGSSVGGTSSGGTKERVLSNIENPVTIRKTIFPSKNKDYLSGEKATVFVEIKNNKRNPTFSNITALGIWEIPDDELGISTNSAKWKYTNLITESNDIKLDLMRGDTAASERLNEYNNCNNKTDYYLLFTLNNLTSLDSSQKRDIINSLYKYFDISWITKDDVLFLNMPNKIIIKNQRDDKIEIHFDNPSEATLKISGIREYKLKVIEKNGINYIYDANSIIDFLVYDLAPKGSILYWYDIKPKKAGNFSTETIIKLYDTDLNYLQDLNYPIQIEVKESKPIFEIHPKPNKKQVYSSRQSFPSLNKPDFVDVIYDISFIGGVSGSTIENVTLDFDRPNNKGDYFYFVDQNGIENESLGNKSSFRNFSKFYKYETKELLMHIAFPNKGIYPLPGIWINGAHYGFEEMKIEIIVDDFIQRNKEKIGWTVAIFGVIFGVIFGEIYQAELRAWSKKHPLKAGLIIGGLLILIILLLTFAI